MQSMTWRGRWVGVAVLAIALAAPDAIAAPRSGYAHRARMPKRAAALIDNTTHMDVNNIDMFVTNHGSIAYDLTTGNSGLIYPKGGTRTAVYAAGLWVGAKVGGETRVAVGEYDQEFTPGPMVGGTYQADNPGFKNFRIVRGETMSPADTALYFAQGGPRDGFGNPLLLGDATLWSVFNDADPGVHANGAGSTAPLGLEVQQTVFAFNRSGALGNTIFVKWKFINKGGNTLDSTYCSVWSDPDLGGFTDDLVGCDTTLSLGYCYNATNSDGQYGGSPPAVGFDFLQGPIVPNGAVNDTLGMASFNKYINGTDPASQDETYNFMQGLQRDGSPLHVNDDPLQPVTTFQVPGDPVTGSGWLDSNPNDRRLMLSAGPFTMLPGDSQEVVAAIIIGQGSDRLSSITQLKQADALAQEVFDLGFDICPPPPSPTVYAQPLERGVRLVWGSEPTGFQCSRPQLNQDYGFEGFRVWQMSSNDPNSDPTVIATYDEVNGVTNLYSDELGPTGNFERKLKVVGTDSGLSFQLDITDDAILGGQLVNNKDYFYAVTAYSYDRNKTDPYVAGGGSVGIVTDVLESARNVITIAPKTSSAVFTTPTTAVSTGPLNIDGFVDVNQLVQNDITGDTYRVTFDDQERWSLLNVTTNTSIFPEPFTDTNGNTTWDDAEPFVDQNNNGAYDVGEPFTDTNGNTLYDPAEPFVDISGNGKWDDVQPNVSGGFDNPVSQGVMVRPTAPRGVVTFGELAPDSSLLPMDAGELDATGTWHFLNRGDPSVYNFLYPDNHDYEIRFLPDTTQYCWLWGSGEVSFVATFKVPFQVWDLGLNSLSDPSDDVQLSVMARDRNLGGLPDGRWNWVDRLYIRKIPYADVDWDTTGGAPNPLTKSTDYVPDGTDQVVGGWQPELDDTLYTLEWPQATTVRIINQRFSSADAYEFTTVKVGATPGDVVGRDVNKILAVPNPYYGHSKYELTQFDRVMKFTNIPASHKVTIRIFNLGGDLVRVITREASTPDEQAVATINWDLNTDRNLPVASGVYVYRVDVDGVGSKTDRLAVFIEQERLDNF
ncbi:MAG TPA: hypothetical protein VFS09_10020 [Candidatus Eisenbacteria bacterium]|nr:hypothetical protein [Candidatus Eisenbacteria bacterium]